MGNRHKHTGVLERGLKGDQGPSEVAKSRRKMEDMPTIEGASPIETYTEMGLYER